LLKSRICFAVLYGVALPEATVGSRSHYIDNNTASLCSKHVTIIENYDYSCGSWFIGISL